MECTSRDQLGQLRLIARTVELPCRTALLELGCTEHAIDAIEQARANALGPKLFMGAM